MVAHDSSAAPVVFRPQPGPQTAFLSSQADITIYGGAAGGGKTFGILLDALRGVTDPNFRAVYFRRVMPNITNKGGLWDESKRIYPHFGGQSVESPQKEWRFPSGATLQFTHLQHEHTKESHKGGQYTLIVFDELTEFTEGQFWYMLSRNRSPGSRFRPWMRATTNPDASSWVRELLDWWIGEDGLAIRERSGVVRWMVREGDAIRWLDDEERAQHPHAMSFTFISASVTDNRALLDADPTYLNRLKMLDRVEREKLLGGNWNITARAGLFQHHQISPDDAVYREQVPEDVRWCRYWDLANTEISEKNPDPCATAGVLVGLRTEHDDDGTQRETVYLLDVAHARLSGDEKRRWMRRELDADGEEPLVFGGAVQWSEEERAAGEYTVAVEQEPGSTGKEVAQDYVTDLFSGFHAVADRPQGSKTARAQRWLPLAERRRRVLIVRTTGGEIPAWWPKLRAELGSFPAGDRDIIDGISGAYKVLRDQGAFWWAEA